MFDICADYIANSDEFAKKSYTPQLSKKEIGISEPVEILWDCKNDESVKKLKKENSEILLQTSTEKQKSNHDDTCVDEELPLNLKQYKSSHMMQVSSPEIDDQSFPLKDGKKKTYDRLVWYEKFNF